MLIRLSYAWCTKYLTQLILSCVFKFIYVVKCIYLYLRTRKCVFIRPEWNYSYMNNANRILLYQSRVCTPKIDRIPLNLRRKIKGHESPSTYKEKHESPLIRSCFSLDSFLHWKEATLLRLEAWWVTNLCQIHCLTLKLHLNVIKCSF